MRATSARAKKAPDRQTLPAPAHRETMGLHLYAAVCLELAEPLRSREEVFTLFRITEADFVTADADWRARLAGDPALLRDYDRVYDYQRSQRRLRMPREGRVSGSRPVEGSVRPIKA
jgi:hypothetical protein